MWRSHIFATTFPNCPNCPKLSSVFHQPSQQGNMYHAHTCTSNKLAYSDVAWILGESNETYSLKQAFRENWGWIFPQLSRISISGSGISGTAAACTMKHALALHGLGWSTFLSHSFDFKVDNLHKNRKMHKKEENYAEKGFTGRSGDQFEVGNWHFAPGEKGDWPALRYKFITYYL